jgi:hypothetical protein
MHPGVEHGDEHVGDCPAGARSVPGDAVEPYEQGRTHHLGGQRRSEPSGVAHDEEHLLAADLLRGESDVAVVTHLRGHPVHGLAGAKGAVEDGT